MNDADHASRPALLPFLAVLRVQGPDAATFLQGQVTHDTRLLGDGRTLLAAVNNPQGRVVALLRLRGSPQGIDALLPADLAEAVAARLRKFVLRAKVDVRVAADLRAVGIRADRPPRHLDIGLQALRGRSDGRPPRDGPSERPPRRARLMSGWQATPRASWRSILARCRRWCRCRCDGGADAGRRERRLISLPLTERHKLVPTSTRRACGASISLMG